MSESLLVAGMGYCGGVIARTWLEDHEAVLGSVRSPAGLTREHPNGAQVCRRDFDAMKDDSSGPGIMARFGVLAFGPSGSEPSASARRGLRWLVSGGVRRVVYLSSTSVYGDCGGAWVDGDTRPSPDTAMGRERVAVESALLADAEALRVDMMLLRLPGIYGPFRNLAERLIAGTYRYPDLPSRWSNRIHVSDVARATCCLLDRGQPGSAYLGCDGTPFKTVDALGWCCDELGISLPSPVGIRDLSPRARTFWSSNRRCASPKLRHLGWSPVYGSFREGLLACREQERDA